jgi:hypothetical protein
MRSVYDVRPDPLSKLSARGVGNMAELRANEIEELSSEDEDEDDE